MKTIIKRMSVQLVKESAHKYDVPRTLRSPEDAAEFIKNVIDFDSIPCELFIVVPIDSQNKPLCVTVVTKGTLNCSLVHPREVFQPCLLANAAACFVFHNHPSGDTTPSREDKAITERLVNAGHILNIPVLDHIIVGDNFYSFRTDGTEERSHIEW